MSTITKTVQHPVAASEEGEMGIKVAPEFEAGLSPSAGIPKTMKAATVVEVCVPNPR